LEKTSKGWKQGERKQASKVKGNFFQPKIVDYWNRLFTRQHKLQKQIPLLRNTITIALWIRNCSAQTQWRHRVPASPTLSGASRYCSLLCSSERCCTCNSEQRADVIAAILKVWRHVRNSSVNPRVFSLTILPKLIPIQFETTELGRFFWMKSVAPTKK